MTNRFLAASALLSAGLTAVHIFAGGVDVHAPMLASPLDPLLKGYASVLWHGITTALIVASAALWIAARTPSMALPLSGMVLAHYIGFAGLFIAYDLSRFGTLMAMPQWIAFGVLSALIAAGLWRRA